MKKLIIKTFALLAFLVPATIFAQGESLVGAGGYDLVSYHVVGKPVKGTGFNQSTYNGVDYVFASKETKKLFDANPQKYLPAYGGYCAFGAALGKKFIADPTVWKIEDGRLFFNLDNNIQAKWEADLKNQISKADKNWLKIKDKKASEL